MQSFVGLLARAGDDELVLWEIEIVEGVEEIYSCAGIIVNFDLALI